MAVERARLPRAHCRACKVKTSSPHRRTYLLL